MLLIGLGISKSNGVWSFSEEVSWAPSRLVCFHLPGCSLASQMPVGVPSQTCSLSFNPWAKHLFAVHVWCPAVLSHGIPGGALCPCSPCWQLAQELPSVHVRNCPSEHLGMLLRRLQGCVCPARSCWALSMSALELLLAVPQPSAPLTVQRFGVSLALPAEEHKGSRRPRNSLTDAFSDFSLHHAAKSFVLDSRECEIVMALYRDSAF